MNERYSAENRTGVTRKSAASAKPKAKAAASVTIKPAGSKGMTAQEKKAARKREEQTMRERQRDLDRKYYKPDTEKYKKLRRNWWISLGAAVVCVLISWFTRTIEPSWISFAALILAYAFIIYAFYLDFSKIRKERAAYQEKMAKIEAEEEKKYRQTHSGHTRAEDEAAAKAAAEAEMRARGEKPKNEIIEGVKGLFKRKPKETGEDEAVSK